MEQTNQQQNRVEGSQSRVEDLHLDRVVASQPEIGPTPPDGGYGWLIVVSSIIYNVTVPTVLSLYGLIILKAVREEDHEEGERMRIWDADIALVPVIMVVIRLLLESWCRAIAKIFNMPRFMAIAGLCLTVAGVLLSSYSTDANSNDHIVNIFAGFFAGAGCALTGQQAEVIVTHYFRDKLTIAQRLVRMAPSVGNFFIPLLVGYLATQHTGDVIVKIYAAIIMQNCLFLAAYSRPVYIEKVIRTTYNKILEAVEDEDEIVYNRRQQEQEQRDVENPNRNQEDDANDVVVFKSKEGAKEIVEPEVKYREKQTTSSTDRFSSDFSSMFQDQSSSNRFSSDFTANRFSSDFGTLDIANSYSRVTGGYQELDDIYNQNPQPLYRETTVDAPEGLVFPTEMSSGTIRRTASLKKNIITVMNMLMDVNFYLYALLQLCTTFSILILSLVFPVFLWEQNPSLNIWSVATLTAAAHGTALCFITLCIVMPKSINQKARLCAFFCIVGTVGFYGITVSSSKSYLVVWAMFASFATAASSILQQPFYNSMLNEFDTTATITSSNAIVAIFIMSWSLAYNYEFRTCFLTATILQVLTACVFLAASFRRRR